MGIYHFVGKITLRVRDTQATFESIYDPLEKQALFDYLPSRSRDGPNEMLHDFPGYLQVDGYTDYDDIARRKGVIAVGCMAHVRRYFVEAKGSDNGRAEWMLTHIQRLYAIERSAREGGFSYEKRHSLRKQEAQPILDEIKVWLDEQCLVVLPMGIHPFGKSLMGKAVGYMLNHWKRLGNYLLDGRLEIGNPGRPGENAIRPVALGRKNYLFAGSHDGAKRAALVYSLVATTKMQEVEPFWRSSEGVLWTIPSGEYLRDVIGRITDYPYPG